MRPGDRISGDNSTFSISGNGNGRWDDVLRGQKVVLLHIPDRGELSRRQVNAYLACHAQMHRNHDVSQIYVVSLEDCDTVQKWAQTFAGKTAMECEYIKFINDHGLAKKLGLQSTRWALVVDEGTVGYVGIEQDPLNVRWSSVEHVLIHLD